MKPLLLGLGLWLGVAGGAFATEGPTDESLLDAVRTVRCESWNYSTQACFTGFRRVYNA